MVRFTWYNNFNVKVCQVIDGETLTLDTTLIVKVCHYWWWGSPLDNIKVYQVLKFVSYWWWPHHQ